MIIFKVTELSKKYHQREILTDINFTLEKNKITALVGVNGAGKSTLLKIMVNLLAWQKGKIIFNHHDLEKNPFYFQKNLRFLSEINPLIENLTIKEYLEYLSILWLETKGKLNDQTTPLSKLMPMLAKLRLANRQNSQIKNLSKGLKQRVGIIGCLIGNPQLIILDEPFSGLDPRQIVEMREFIISLKKRITFFFSTHLLSEVSHIADQVLFINEGKIIGKEKIKQSFTKSLHVNSLEKKFLNFLEKDYPKGKK